MLGKARVYFITAALLALAGMYLRSISFGALFGLFFFLALGAFFALMGILSLLAQERGRHAKRAKTAQIAGWILLILWGLSFVFVQGLIVSGAKSDDFAKADYVIVLGAKIDRYGPSYALKSRLDKAVSYMKQYPESTAVVCGGHGWDEPASEASVMAKYLEASGISPQHIILEDQSTSTEENVAFAKRLIEKAAGGKSYKAIVVTNEFHLYRARKIMKSAGLDNLGLSAETPFVGLKITGQIREYFAIIKDIFALKIQ